MNAMCNTDRSTLPTGGAVMTSVWLPSKKSRGKFSRRVDNLTHR